MSGATLRFAPSPNGRLHLGHAYSALLNDRVARRLGGAWLLRIEDIDPVRSTPETIAGVIEDLAWLGLHWPEPVRRQSDHMAAYREAAARLRGAGLLYPCTCSRREVVDAVARRERASSIPWPRDPDGMPVYPGTCRGRPRSEIEDRVAAGRPIVWRVDMAAALARSGPVAWRSFDPEGGTGTVPARPGRWGDVVVVRGDVPTSYHLAVVVDDAAQAITHVVRGRDLEAATDIHAVLAACLGLDAPLYHHHGLLADADGRKLSKSRNSPSLAARRAAGDTAAAIRVGLGFG